MRNDKMKNKMNSNNPVVQEVIDNFNTINKMAGIFARPNGSAIKGLLISGDAGTGKTNAVMNGVYSVVQNADDVIYLKGASMTAAALFCKMYLAREKGKVLVLDDVDIIHKSSQELSTILDLFKAATEMTKDDRVLSWERASANQLMNQLGVPMSYVFEGSIIWITNDHIVQIENKAKGHWNAISSRFNINTIYLNDQEKLLYTLFLVEEVGMLGKNCNTKDGGYSEEIIKTTTDYIRKNYKYLHEVTPRIAAKIADLMESFPEDWKVMCDNQLMSL
jgi:hypothetical protein